MCFDSPKFGKSSALTFTFAEVTSMIFGEMKLLIIDTKLSSSENFPFILVCLDKMVLEFTTSVLSQYSEQPSNSSGDRIPSLARASAAGLPAAAGSLWQKAEVLRHLPSFLTDKFHVGGLILFQMVFQLYAYQLRKLLLQSKIGFTPTFDKKIR